MDKVDTYYCEGDILWIAWHDRISPRVKKGVEDTLFLTNVTYLYQIFFLW